MSANLARRDFLNPARFAAKSTAADELSKQRIPTVTLRREAMACMFEIQLAADDPGRECAARAFDRIDELEAQLTVYRDDSEVSAINRDAAEKAIAVEPALFELLCRCDHWTKLTNGAFDITSSPLIRAWGFMRRRGRVPTAAEIADAMRVTGMDKVILNTDVRTIQFVSPGVEINLGSVGKGFAIDLIANEFKSRSLRSALLSAGHSSVLALGKPAWDTAWQVELRDPRAEDACLATARLFDNALSTTSSAQQFFEHEGKRYGHVLNPTTGWPATGVLQATALAEDAATAEALSTAFFVNGVEWTRGFCLRHPKVSGLLLPDQPEAKPFIFDNSHVISLPKASESKAPR